MSDEPGTNKVIALGEANDMVAAIRNCWACPECNGLATDDGSAFGEPCPACDGDGIIEPWMLDLAS